MQNLSYLHKTSHHVIMKIVIIERSNDNNLYEGNFNGNPWFWSSCLHWDGKICDGARVIHELKHKLKHEKVSALLIRFEAKLQMERKDWNENDPFNEKHSLWDYYRTKSLLDLIRLNYRNIITINESIHSQNPQVFRILYMILWIVIPFLTIIKVFLSLYTPSRNPCSFLKRSENPGGVMLWHRRFMLSNSMTPGNSPLSLMERRHLGVNGSTKSNTTRMEQLKDSRLDW